MGKGRVYQEKLFTSRYFKSCLFLEILTNSNFFLHAYIIVWYSQVAYTIILFHEIIDDALS